MNMNTVSCNLMGGLGNQLFQIFSTISYGIDTNRSIIFPYSNELNIGVTRPTYWDTFLQNIISFTSIHNNQISNSLLYNFDRFNETAFHFNEIPTNLNNRIMLNGYFQSYKYFIQNKETIFSLINLQKQQQTTVLSYQNYFNTHNTTISMHFRFGDYLNLTHIYTILDFQYYFNAISKLTNLINNKITILYFCENKDNEIVNEIINKLLLHFSDISFIKVDDNICDWKQLLIMSCCDHNIIANSTFSWWGAYLNTNINKIVCYPNKWFSTNIANKTIDLFPEEWLVTNIMKN